MDTQHQHFQKPDDIDSLRSQNAELKASLEREQLLHAMLYKEWKELSEKMAAQQNEAYENSRPKNLFYKYGFYVVLLCIIPAYYFLRPANENKIQVPPAQVVVVPSLSGDSIQAGKVPAQGDSDEASVKPIKQQPPIQPAISDPIEKKGPQPDTSQPKRLIVMKPVIEAPLDDSMRDSIYWVGWNAYFNKSRNHFKKSTEKYKIWLQGWKDGRSDAEKLIAKKDSLKK